MKTDTRQAVRRYAENVSCCTSNDALEKVVAALVDRLCEDWGIDCYGPMGLAIATRMRTRMEDAVSQAVSGCMLDMGLIELIETSGMPESLKK